MKSTMSSVDIYFTFYRNIKFYSNSLKHRLLNLVGYFEKTKGILSLKISSIIFSFVKSKCANLA